jgi:hypothetical protein
MIWVGEVVSFKLQASVEQVVRLSSHGPYELRGPTSLSLSAYSACMRLPSMHRSLTMSRRAKCSALDAARSMWIPTWLLWTRKSLSSTVTLFYAHGVQRMK